MEIAVLLNDLAYLKYEKIKDSLDAESVLLKQRNLGIAFSLVEKTIKLISSVAEDEGMHLLNYPWLFISFKRLFYSIDFDSLYPFFMYR